MRDTGWSIAYERVRCRSRGLYEETDLKVSAFADGFSVGEKKIVCCKPTTGMVGMMDIIMKYNAILGYCRLKILSYFRRSKK